MFTKTAKILALILALVMVFALAITGCGKKAAEDDEDASSVTSSTSAPSKPAVNEEAKEILDKYTSKLPDSKALWFADMEYVSLITEDEGMIFLDQYGYEGEEIKRLVHLVVSSRENLVKLEYIAEDTDEAIEAYFNEIKEDSDGDGAEFVSYYINKDDKNVAFAQIVDKNDRFYSDVFDATLSEVVNETLEYGGVLEFGKKSDYVKEDNTPSDDNSSDDNGNGEVVETTREENPAYAAVFAKYGFSEPNVMAGGEFNVVAIDNGDEGVEVNYYFAKPTGEIVSFLSYNIMKRADFVEDEEAQDDDEFIEYVLQTTAQAMKSTYGVDLDYSFDKSTVTMSISTTANNSELDVDCIGKQLRDVVAADVADGGVQKYLD